MQRDRTYNIGGSRYFSKNCGLELTQHAVERYLKRVGRSFYSLEGSLREVVLSNGGFSSLRGRRTITYKGVTYVFFNRLVVSCWREPV